MLSFLCRTIVQALQFDIREVTAENFEAYALRLFQYQYSEVNVYRQYVDLLRVKPSNVCHLNQIPFLPISFFKSQRVSDGRNPEAVFLSSTTTGSTPSKHHVRDLKLYELACLEGFKRVYGDPREWCFLALLPSYLERGNSSLVWMVNALMRQSKNPDNGFFLHDFENLTHTVKRVEAAGMQAMVIGVAYALLDWAETWAHQGVLNHTVIMETGGMKGRRKEMVKEEMHAVLMNAFGVKSVHAEYGMTELLSQAYSKGGGVYRCPSWMKVSTRDLNDPFHQPGVNETGVINIIDLANQYSCAFIATDDLGKVHTDGTFEILGRLDYSEMRGCNLLVG